MKPVITRRDLISGTLGVLGGVGIGRLLRRPDPYITARDAHARGLSFRVLSADEADTMEALAEILLPGARAAGVAHFVDQQLAVPAEESLLQARNLNIKPPYLSFYRDAINAIEQASDARGGRLAVLDAGAQHDLVDRMRQNKLDKWKGPPASLVYMATRSDAVDVVFGTVEGYASLGIPYMAHILPTQRW